MLLRRGAGQPLTTHHPPTFEIEAGVPFHRAWLPIERVPSAGTARISLVISSALGWQLSCPHLSSLVEVRFSAESSRSPFIVASRIRASSRLREDDLLSEPMAASDSEATRSSGFGCFDSGSDLPCKLGVSFMKTSCDSGIAVPKETRLPSCKSIDWIKTSRWHSRPVTFL